MLTKDFHANRIRGTTAWHLPSACGAEAHLRRLSKQAHKQAHKFHGHIIQTLLLPRTCPEVCPTRTKAATNLHRQTHAPVQPQQNQSQQQHACVHASIKQESKNCCMFASQKGSNHDCNSDTAAPYIVGSIVLKNCSHVHQDHWTPQQPYYTSTTHWGSIDAAGIKSESTPLPAAHGYEALPQHESNTLLR